MSATPDHVPDELVHEDYDADVPDVEALEPDYEAEETDEVIEVVFEDGETPDDGEDDDLSLLEDEQL